MKCLLLHIPKLIKKNNEYQIKINYISMGVFSICSELIKNGYETEIIHLGLEKCLDKNFSIAKYVKENNVDFVAISLHWHPQSFDSIEIAKVIKQENPNVKIVVGGFTATCFPKEILEKFSFIDFVIAGEGEFPMVQLAKNLEQDKNNFSSIPNLCWRDTSNIIFNKERYVANEEELNSFQFINFEYLKNYEKYFNLRLKINISQIDCNVEKRLYSICCGRGCLGNCSWCGGGVHFAKYSGRNVITRRTVKNIVQDIIILKDKYKIDKIHISFDPTPNNQKEMIDVLNELSSIYKDKIKLQYECFGIPTKEFIDAFANTCSDDSTILISPEFADEDLRKKHKSFYYSNKELEETLDYISKFNIKCEVFFAKIPNLTEEQNQNTRNYADRIKQNYNFEAYIISVDLEPGCKWFDNPDLCGRKYNRSSFEDFYNKNYSIENSFDGLKFEVE